MKEGPLRRNVIRHAAVLAAFAVVAFVSGSMSQTTHADRDLKIGDIQVRMIQDAQFNLKPSLLSGIDPKDALRLTGGGDSAWTPANAFLVRMPNQIVLVDAGVGGNPGEDSGRLLIGLKHAGVDPAQVDLILITHFHFDHIGGLVSPEGKRVFPKAIVRVSKAENDFWMRDSSSIPENLRQRALSIKAAFAPYMEGKSYTSFTPDEKLGDGIRALSAYGHTPGHTVFSFASKGKELWCIGDLIHFGAIQFEHPSAYVRFDSDGAQAVASRIDFFQRAAASHVILAGAHLPAMVQIERKGSLFVPHPVEVR
jgi:glyoxylase-like metal-dependent hydrolase (beta-lactamase superfamily II)